MRFSAILFLLLLVPFSNLHAQVNGEILEREVDEAGNGYTIMRVWGTYHEMGYAHGYLLAPEIDALVEGIKDYMQSSPWLNYEKIKTSVSSTWFLPTDVETEIDGIVEGVNYYFGETVVNQGDIKVANTISDWLYAPYCRSHSCWGSFVQAPTRTLSTRRLDFPDLPVPFTDHVLCARIPAGSGKSRWVNLAFPGYVTVITGVNEYGTVVSLHDYKTLPPHAVGGDVITRSAAARFALTMDLPADISLQLDQVYYRLQPYTPFVGSFINCYVPEGYGGVFTCYPDSGFYKKRTPHPDYFNGEVLVTSNEETDGSYTPSGAEFLEDYYNGTKPKQLEDHWTVLTDHDGIHGFHQLSVAYRGREDMTLWFDGRYLAGEEHYWTSRVAVEWSELFNSSGGTRPVLSNGDYNGDGTDEIAIFRGTAGLWAIRSVTRVYFGSSSDIPVPGDYDGDGSSDIGIFRGSTGLWAIRGVTRSYFGGNSDTAIPGDYDGDGYCDFGIFRGASGLWAIRGVSRVYFGTSGDTPVPGDYNGNGTKDIGIFRGSSGLWALRSVSRIYFGSSGDTSVPGDYDGNGTWKPAVFRAGSGLWAIRGVSRAYFGGSLDQPVPANYTGSGTDDIGIFRDSPGLWAIRSITRIYFGGSSDIPVTR